ncbi:DUF397 domain-containing protein [Kitasatospora sp. NA04385]|uniref:DUF397 domain-containing protein n=1 Tax=Kitasatospora sp. NA04385 TaxID=2742135 RepID=UPI0020CB53C3|nr:DUF397 domain-containing protein [Kitasatospora sp. NA04385]
MVARPEARAADGRTGLDLLCLLARARTGRGGANIGHVRDSKNPHGPHLEFTPTAWAAFVTATVAGEFGQV